VSYNSRNITTVLLWLIEYENIITELWFYFRSDVFQTVCARQWIFRRNDKSLRVTRSDAHDYCENNFDERQIDVSSAPIANDLFNVRLEDKVYDDTYTR